jgi:hypothetical protein
MMSRDRRDITRRVDSSIALGLCSASLRHDPIDLKTRDLVIGGVISKLLNIKQGNICKLLCSHLNTQKSTYLFPINGVR